MLDYNFLAPQTNPAHIFRPTLAYSSAIDFKICSLLNEFANHPLPSWRLRFMKIRRRVKINASCEQNKPSSNPNRGTQRGVLLLSWSYRGHIIYFDIGRMGNVIRGRNAVVVMIENKRRNSEFYLLLVDPF